MLYRRLILQFIIYFVSVNGFHLSTNVVDHILSVVVLRGCLEMRCERGKMCECLATNVAENGTG